MQRHPSWDSYVPPAPDPYHVVHIGRDGATHRVRMRDSGNEWDRYQVTVNGEYVAYNDDDQLMIAVFDDAVAYVRML